MSEQNVRTTMRKFGIAWLGASALVSASLSSPAAFAAPHGGFRGGGAVYRPHGGFGRFGGGHRHGLGVGAAVGLGVLGAAAAGVAASQYNGYPVYSDGYHRGYGYDYYPDHGGYYGPY